MGMGYRGLRGAAEQDPAKDHPMNHPVSGQSVPPS